MAFANGLRSPPNDSSLPTNYAPQIRPIGSQFSPNVATSSADRAQLHRRFTTNALPTLPTLSSFGPLSPIGQQRRQAAEPAPDLAAAVSATAICLQSRAAIERNYTFIWRHDIVLCACGVNCASYCGSYCGNDTAMNGHGNNACARTCPLYNIFRPPCLSQ